MCKEAQTSPHFLVDHPFVLLPAFGDVVDGRRAVDAPRSELLHRVLEHHPRSRGAICNTGRPSWVQGRFHRLFWGPSRRRTLAHVTYTRLMRRARPRVCLSWRSPMRTIQCTERSAPRRANFRGVHGSLTSSHGNYICLCDRDYGSS